MPELCPNCGKGFHCKFCDYAEPANLFMRSRHDFETEVALADNVREQMAELYEAILRFGQPELIRGEVVYKITKPTPNAPSGRVIRIPLSLYHARGNTFTRPKNYAERRDSDKRTLQGYYSAHRITPKHETPSKT